MGDSQLLPDVLGAHPLLLTPAEAVRRLGAGRRTTIRPRPPARAEAGPVALPMQPNVVAGREGSR